MEKELNDLKKYEFRFIELLGWHVDCENDCKDTKHNYKFYDDNNNCRGIVIVNDDDIIIECDGKCVSKREKNLSSEQEDSTWFVMHIKDPKSKTIVSIVSSFSFKNIMLVI